MLRCSIFYLSAVCPFQTAQQSTQTQPTHSQTNLCIYVCVFVAKSYARLRAMRIFSISSSARILPLMRYYYSNADALAEIACCFCLTLPSLQGILHTLLSVCMCFCCWCCSQSLPILPNGVTRHSWFGHKIAALPTKVYT